MFWWGLLIGIFVGANIGLLVLAMCFSANENEKLSIKMGQNITK